jgi:hypothetical protein
MIAFAKEFRDVSQGRRWKGGRGVPWKHGPARKLWSNSKQANISQDLDRSAADTIIGWNDNTCWMIFSESCGRRRADVVETNRLHPHLFARTPGYLTIHGALARL